MKQKEETYHFIGLGGIGMSALARILLQQGKTVHGSDAAESPLLQELRKEGALVRIGHQEEMPSKATVVYSTDIKENNVELAAAKKNGYPMLHRAELLDQLMVGKKGLLVTGTHGKTTTTALLSEVVMEAGFDPTFVVGGILMSTQSNSHFGKGDYFIAEADESDGSFLKTAAFGAIITSLENDHLDHWKSEENLDQAFKTFISQVKQSDLLFWCADSDRLSDLKPNGQSYGFCDSADLRIRNFRPTDKGSLFDISYEGKHYQNIELPLFGNHNALNGAAVFGLALRLGINENTIRKAFENFKGTKRRFELKGEAHRLQLYDDYAHHPTKISVTLRALRDKIREKRLVALFQPHRYSRVQDLFKNFAAAFDEADLVVMTDIYSAREAAIPGITSEALFQEMKKKLKDKLVYIPREKLEAEAPQYLQPFDVAITLGAGDITYAGLPILKAFAARAPKLKVAVLAGGTSVEHEVSLRSGKTVENGLDPTIFDPSLFGVAKDGHWIFGKGSFDQLQKAELRKEEGARMAPEIFAELSQCDLAIPAFHGPEGEDGMMQGLLDTLQIPYVGCDYHSASLCMHKSWAKQIAIMHNIPTAPFVEMDVATFRRDPRKLIKLVDERGLRYPLYVKPVHLGSSIGVTRAVTPQDLIEGAKAAFELDDLIIVEQEIIGRELEVSVLGNDYIRIPAPAMVMHSGGTYTYDQKYGSQPIEKRIPAPITPAQHELLRELTSRIYKALGCKGLARIDFFIDQNGHFWFNEANPFPGFTSASGYPKMWATSGLTISQLCDEFVILALHRRRRIDTIRVK